MTEIDAAASPIAYALPVTPTATERSKAWATVRQVLWTIALVIVLAGFVWCMRLYFAPAINHPDANGYWAQGSLMMEHGRTYLVPESNAAYIGMHWLMLGDNFFISRYPPGFPLIIGLVQELFGWRATFFINPVLAIATLIGMYLIVTRLTSPGWGLLAVIVLGCNAPFAIHAMTEISHMPVAFCVVWGAYLLLRWSESGWVWWVFGAGLVLGCIPSTRYADSVVAIGVTVFLLMHVRRFPKIWKHYLYAAGGAAIPILPLLIRNQLMFGKFWATGYTLTNESTGFSMEYFKQHAIGYLQAMQGGGLGVMFALGLIGMIWMLCVSRTRALSLMLLFAAVPFVMVYMAYYWAMGIGGGPGGGPGGGNVGGALRFLVPIVPLFIIPGVWALDQIVRAAPMPARITIPIILLALQLTMYVPSLRDELRNTFDRKSVLAMATDALEQSVPEGSVVVADQSLLQHLDFVRKWKLADSSLVSDRQGRGGMGGGGPGGNNRGRLQGAGGPPGMGGPPGGMFPGGPDGNDQDQPSPQQRDKTEARMKLYTGSAEQKQDKFLDDLAKWAGEKDVYVVGKESDLQRLLPGTKNLKIVKRVKTPEPPPEPQQANAFGRGGAFGNRMRGGGPFGSFIQPGEEFVIAKW